MGRKVSWENVYLGQGGLDIEINPFLLAEVGTESDSSVGPKIL